MKCAKCGSENPDGTKFCGECGEPLVSYERVDEKTSEKTEINVSVKKKRKKWKIVGAILVVLCIIGMIPTGSSDGGADNYEDVVQAYYEARFSADAEEALAIVPDDVIAYALESGGYSSSDEDLFQNSIQEEYGYLLALYDEKYGEGWTTTYEIIGEKDIMGSKLAELQAAYDEIGLNVSEAKKVTIEVTFSRDNLLGMDNSTDIPIGVVKIDGYWYADWLEYLLSSVQYI